MLRILRVGPRSGLALLASLAALPLPALRAGGEASKPASIAVRDGSARVDVAHAEPGARTLLIVSALARESGPFPIRMAARRVDSARPAELADDGPKRPVRASTSTPTGPLPDAIEPALPPPERAFSLLMSEGDPACAGNYRAIRAMLRAIGRCVQVYVDEDDLERFGPDALREVVSTFDDRIEPATARALGRAPDVDGDGRFTVLVTGKLGHGMGGRRAVDGFVRSADLDPDLPSPFGNRRDMLALNAAMGPGPHLRTVLAHEYAHAVLAGLKAFGGPGGTRSGPEEDGWLDEAIAHLAEDLLGDSRTNLDYRISAFLNDPSRYRLVVADYVEAGLFRGHGNRGSTYLFLRWCADREGPDLLGRLARSKRRGVAAIEEATGTPFEALFRRWTLALAGAGPAGDGFRAFDPMGTVGDHLLAGPRSDRLTPGGAGLRWDAAGTSPHFTVIEGDGPLSVEITGPPEARLQVTAIPLPAALPVLEMTAFPVPGPDGTTAVRLRVREIGGASARLDGIAWEPPVPDSDPRRGLGRVGGLGVEGVVSAFGTADLPAGGVLESSTIALKGGGPLVFKAVATDSRGRRAVAWADCDPDRVPDSGRVARLATSSAESSRPAGSPADDGKQRGPASRERPGGSDLGRVRGSR